MKPYWWFQGASVASLIAALEAAGADARLEVHLDGDKMTLFVVPTGGAAVASGGGIDDSHVCPPQCP